MKENPDDLFEKFLKAATCKATLQTFRSLCEEIDISYPPQRGDSYEHVTFYPRLKQALGKFWKAQSLFNKLDKKYDDEINLTKRKNSRDGQERVAKDFNVLIVGAGPCGLRTAVFTAMLGAKTVVVEKRDSFSRNNVLHLWPFTIEDLKALGAKKFNGRFCSGAIDHVSIRQLQLILMKAALIFGVEIHVNTAFVDIIPPNVPDDKVWTAKIDPVGSPISEYGFHMIVGADGRKNTLNGFERKTFRGSLAIGITVNFINKRSKAEAMVSEISGINFIYRQEFFRDLNRKHDIDLENIVYYKDDTHYFVMTARKQSLLRRQVLRQNLDDPAQLVHSNNIDPKALLEYALDAVNFSTENKLPDLEVAINNYGRPDIALFDFTSMKSSINASMFLEVHGVKLLQGLVGDGLMEPFWPKGTGIAKGFLAAYDTCWMLRQWALGIVQDKSNDRSLEMSLLGERESLYRILAQVETNNLMQNYPAFSLDPKTRYQYTPKKLSNGQVKCFYVTDSKCAAITKQVEIDGQNNGAGLSKLTRNVSFVRSNKLLNWCEKVLRDSGSEVLVKNMTSSWKDGRALCSIINYYKPEILELNQIQENNAEFNNQLAFDIANDYLGVTPIMSGKEMAECETVDDLLMVTYLTQFYELFKNETPVRPVGRVSDIIPTPKDDNKSVPRKKKSSPLALISKVAMQIKRKKAQLGSVREYDVDSGDKKRRKTGADGEVAIGGNSDIVLTKAEDNSEETQDIVVLRNSPKMSARTNATKRISALQQQLISQFEPSVSAAQNQASANSQSTNSNVCYFCTKTVYIVERLSVEGLFFHRQCFKCSYCGKILSTLNYRRDCDSGKFYCDAHYFANAEYLKPQYASDEVVGTMEAMEEDDASVSSSKLSPVLFDDLDLSIPTIENGQVVMRKDLTPRRSDMAAMSLAMSSNHLEIEEEEIYEHNIRRSNASETDDYYDSCDSEFEDLDEFVAKIPGLNSQTGQDISRILTDFHNQQSMNENDDSAFLPSDDELSSISSTSADDTELMRQLLEEKSGSAYSSDDAKAPKDQFKHEKEVKSVKEQSEIRDDVSLSTASSHNDDSLDSDDIVVTDDFLDCDSLEIGESDVLRGTDLSIRLERKDTLEGAEKHIKENPIHQKELSSSSSSDDEFEEASAPQQTSFCRESKNVLSISSSSSSDVGTLSSKDSLESVENHIKLHPVSKNRSVSSVSTESEKGTDISTASSADKMPSKSPSFERDFAAPVKKLPDDTSVWVDSSAECMSFSDPISDNLNESVKNKLKNGQPPNIVISASTPKLEPFTPSLSTPDVYATPCATSEREETFYSVQSDQSDQETSPYSSYIDDTERKRLQPTVPSQSNSMKKSISETPTPKPRRKLPIIPHLEVLSPRKSESLPVPSRQTSGRRRLPRIPHLEALSPPAAEDLSPSQRRRIDKKLQKHENRVMERIEKMKFGYRDPLSDDNFSDKAQDERAEFANYVPLLLQKRSSALRKRKPNHNQNFFTGSKENKSKTVATATLPKSLKVMSTSQRSSKKKSFSSYSNAELHHRVLKQAQVAAERQAKEEERKRMAKALVLQGQLEGVDTKRKQLEVRGVELEKLLRDQKLAGGRSRDSSLHMHEWYKLIQEKNALLRYENELYIHQRDLQLEDKKSRLERELRELLAMHESEKNEKDKMKERDIELEMQRCVDQRNELVMLLDEHRMQDREDNDIEKVLKDSLSNLDLATPL